MGSQIWHSKFICVLINQLGFGLSFITIVFFNFSCTIYLSLYIRVYFSNNVLISLIGLKLIFVKLGIHYKKGKTTIAIWMYTSNIVGWFSHIMKWTLISLS